MVVVKTGELTVAENAQGELVLVEDLVPMVSGGVLNMRNTEPAAAATMMTRARTSTTAEIAKLIFLIEVVRFRSFKGI